MKKLFEQRREFNKAMDLPFKTKPSLIDEKRWRLQRDMIVSEVEEYDEACRDLNITEIADALGDILYVTIGAIKEHGLESCMEEIMDEIHKSNMSKVGPDGKVIKDKKGKVQKPEGYFKPNIQKIVLAHLLKEEKQIKLDL